MRFSVAILATILSATAAVIAAPASSIHRRDAGSLIAERDLIDSEFYLARDFRDLEYETVERRGIPISPVAPVSSGVHCDSHNYQMICGTTHECLGTGPLVHPTRKPNLREGTPQNSICATECHC